MIRKIKSSLSLKVFLSIASLLLISSLFIYGIVMIVMPQSYKTELAGQFTDDLSQLLVKLENTNYEESSGLIYNFCITNNAFATLESKTSKINYNIFDKYDNYKSVEPNGRKSTLCATITFRFKNSSELYTLSASASEQPVNQIVDLLIKLLPWIVLLVLVIASLGSLFCTRFLTRPILKLSGISKKMSSLDMTWRCDINRSDEIGVLATSLNSMAQNLDNALNNLKTANEKLQTDIDHERRQAKQRRDFFAAVSHELKTPITILKGQIESMIFGIGAYKDRDKYLQESLKTTENMEKLVKEILMVSKMGTDEYKAQLSSVDISVLLKDCCLEYQHFAEDKNLLFHTSIQENIVSLVDEKLFRKAVSNIIMNAITYSPEGAIISVHLVAEKHQVVLAVKNTDSFIDGNDMEQLFTPFFRVDQSHSRNTGGSGLGLYIVKTILDLHDMNYQIKNTTDGVCFTITFES